MVKKKIDFDWRKEKFSILGIFISISLAFINELSPKQYVIKPFSILGAEVSAGISISLLTIAIIILIISIIALIIRLFKKRGRIK